MAQHSTTISAERKQQAVATKRGELLTEEERKTILEAWLKKAEYEESDTETMTSRSYHHQPDRYIRVTQVSNYPGKTFVGEYGFISKKNPKGEVFTFHTQTEYLYDNATGKFLGKPSYDTSAKTKTYSRAAEIEGDFAGAVVAEDVGAVLRGETLA